MEFRNLPSSLLRGPKNLALDGDRIVWVVFGIHRVIRVCNPLPNVVGESNFIVTGFRVSATFQAVEVAGLGRVDKVGVLVFARFLAAAKPGWEDIPNKGSKGGQACAYDTERRLD